MDAPRKRRKKEKKCGPPPYKVNGGSDMDKQFAGKFQYGLGFVVKATTGLTILSGFLVVIPLTLWFAWARHSAIANSIAVSLFCLSFAWVLVSLLQLNR